MRGSFFGHATTVVTALFHIDGDMERNLALIRRSAADSAQGIALQLEDMPPELRTADNYRKLMDAAPELPFMFISYRKDKYFTDDEARQQCLLLAAETGAEVIDVMGDLFDPAPNELTVDPSAVARQKSLIQKIHGLGAKVVMSSHTPHALSAEQILEHLREQASRGADILKIVTRADTEEELTEAFRTTMLLKRALDRPFIHLCGGKYARPHRYLGPKLGSAIAFAIPEEKAGAVQPTIRRLRTVLDTVDWTH
jgi:3-dehydroquinate dehydratase type I